jgi:transcriptional regulator with XRE-family HTH domain
MFLNFSGIMRLMAGQLDRERVAKYVVARRGSLGMTQEQLAERAGVTVKTVYNLESAGRWPQARTRGAIEKALGWRSGDLTRVGEGGEPVPQAASEEPGMDTMLRELRELEAYFADLRADSGERRRVALAFLRALYGEAGAPSRRPGR